MRCLAPVAEMLPYANHNEEEHPVAKISANARALEIALPVCWSRVSRASRHAVHTGHGRLPRWWIACRLEPARIDRAREGCRADAAQRSRRVLRGGSEGVRRRVHQVLQGRLCRCRPSAEQQFPVVCPAPAGPSTGNPSRLSGRHASGDDRSVGRALPPPRRSSHRRRRSLSASGQRLIPPANQARMLEG